jgi:hypothetical protein
MLRGIVLGRVKAAFRAGEAAQGLTALVAEVIRGGIASPTAWTEAFKPRATCAAELHPVGVLLAIARASHTVSPRRLRWGYGKIPRVDLIKL